MRIFVCIIIALAGQFMNAQSQQYRWLPAADTYQDGSTLPHPEDPRTHPYAMDNGIAPDYSYQHRDIYNPYSPQMAPPQNRPEPLMQKTVDRVQVTDINSALELFLSASGRDLVLLPNRLDYTKLNFSPESLHYVDAWLKDVHTINYLQSDIGQVGEYLQLDGRGDNTVLFAGLYMGEVIRAHSQLGWHWQKFDVFIRANPNFANHYGHQAGLDVFVLVGPQGVTTPINAALKRVLYGKEESLHYIAGLMMREIDIQKAMSGHDLTGLSGGPQQRPQMQLPPELYTAH